MCVCVRARASVYIDVHAQVRVYTHDVRSAQIGFEVNGWVDSRCAERPSIGSLLERASIVGVFQCALLL